MYIVLIQQFVSCQVSKQYYYETRRIAPQCWNNNRIIHKSICSYSREFQILNCLIFQGVLCRTLQGHGHWVNILALSTDYVMRTGAFDPASATVVHAEVTDTGKCQLYCVMYCMQRAATDYWHCKCQHHCHVLSGEGSQYLWLTNSCFALTSMWLRQ